MKSIITTAIMEILFVGTAFGQFDIGLDAYNRYVWRGTDFGDAAALQPHIEYTVGSFTVGAWSSWAVNSGVANENDLYLSANVGSVSFTITDYFFPSYTGEDRFFDYSEKAGSHFVEASIGASLGGLDLTAGHFFIDANNSTYLEAVFGPMLFGVGNGAYTIEKEDEDDVFGIVNIGITASRDLFTASYIINPQQETSFMVFGVSF